MKTPVISSEWFDLFKQGDQTAFDHIYKYHKDAIYFYLYKLTGNKDDAEDITAEAFYALYKNRQSMETQDHIRRFLYTVGRNTAFNVLKGKKRKMSAYLAWENQSWMVEGGIDREKIQAEMIVEIFAEVENLPDRCREVFLMTFVEERSAQEIAAIMQIDRQTVFKQRAKAIEKLRTALLKKGIDLTVLLLSISFSFHSS